MQAVAAGPHVADWQRTTNLLVVRLDNLGDVLMSTPAIGAVAGASNTAGNDKSAVQRRVTLLASRSGAAVAGHVPSLADVMVYDAPWVQAGSLRGSSEAPAIGSADRQLIDQLAARRFDAAIVFTVSTQSALPAALMCRLAGIPRCLAHCRENPYALLTDWVRDTEVIGDGMRHEVTRQLDLVRSVGFETRDERLVFVPSADDVRAARQKLAAAGGDPTRPYVVVHPGSSAASRRYPAERFGQAAGIVAERAGVDIVFAGSADEAPLVAAAQAVMGALGAPSLSLVGALGVGELAALIGGARLLICNNSGPAHLAAAVGTPVVVLYALTNPQHTPWQVASRVLNHDVPCRNCLKSTCPMGHHDCLLRIHAPEVAEAALALLRETADHDGRVHPGGLPDGGARSMGLDAPHLPVGVVCAHGAPALVSTA